MTTQLMQWNFVIEGLIAKEIKIKRKIWIKKGEIFLKKEGELLNVFMLGDDKDTFHNDQKILPFLKISTLISNNSPILKGGGGSSLNSIKEFGKKNVYTMTTEVRLGLPKQAMEEIEKHAPAFIKQIKHLYDKYTLINNENQFLRVSLDCFYDSEIKSVFSNDGFISAMVSMEALFNEGDVDIKYKLAHRAAFLLGFAKFDPISVFDDMKRFYNFRSSLVHGNVKNKTISDKHKISRYARTSIIIMHIFLKNPKKKKIKKKNRKEEILKEMDHAMLVPSKREFLECEIEKGLKDFKLKIPRTFEGKGKDGKYRFTAW